MTISLDLPRIIKELHLDVPIYRVHAHEDCVELHLYGGKVVTWIPPKCERFPINGNRETPVQCAAKKKPERRETRKRRSNP